MMEDGTVDGWWEGAIGMESAEVQSEGVEVTTKKERFAYNLARSCLF